MLWKSLLLSLLMNSKRIFRTPPLQVSPQDIDFNEYLNNILVTLGFIGYALPKAIQKIKTCESDDDCPSELHCCDVETTKFCCTPDNYLKISASKLSYY